MVLITNQYNIFFPKTNIKNKDIMFHYEELQVLKKINLY